MHLPRIFAWKMVDKPKCLLINVFPIQLVQFLVVIEPLCIDFCHLPKIVFSVENCSLCTVFFFFFFYFYVNYVPSLAHSLLDELKIDFWKN